MGRSQRDSYGEATFVCNHKIALKSKLHELQQPQQLPVLLVPAS